MRARNTEQGVPDSTAPAAAAAMDGRVESASRWQPAPFGLGGQMRVQDNFRARFEGVEGVKRRAAAVERVHGPGRAFSHGARDYPELFDSHMRGLDRNDSREPSRAELHARQQIARGRVPHSAPFKGGSAAMAAGSERSFLGHAPFPYHYSPYEASERSLSETTLASGGGGTGFRMRCEHAIHFPMKATKARERLATETDRNPNFHSVQSLNESCRHRCNEVLAHARATSHTQRQFSATAQF